VVGVTVLLDVSGIKICLGTVTISGSGPGLGSVWVNRGESGLYPCDNLHLEGSSCSDFIWVGWYWCWVLYGVAGGRVGQCYADCIIICFMVGEVGVTGIVPREIQFG